VLKSRTAEVWTNLKTLNMAATAYCLENPSGGGVYRSDSDSDLSSALAVEIKPSKYFYYSGSLSCGASIPMAFLANGTDEFDSSLRLWMNPITGRRSCTGGESTCAKVGFTKYAADNLDICTFGGSFCGSSSCFYAD
ncbi:MAG: hypothetical protein ACI4Q7_02980, partial [Candidatus Avelusimicrobium sp.]